MSQSLALTMSFFIKRSFKQVDKGQISTTKNNEADVSSASPLSAQIAVAGQIEPSGQFVSTQVNNYLFQPRSVCFNLGQLVSTQVNLFQPRSVWGRYKTQVTGHRSLFYQYRKYPKHSLKLTFGLSRPEQKFLGLMLPLVNS